MSTYLDTIKSKSVEETRDSILRKALSDLEGIYLPLTYRWIDTERPDLKSEVTKLEKQIDICNYPLLNDGDAEYKNLIKSYINLHKRIIHLYQKHLSNLDKNLNLIKDQNNLVSDNALCREVTQMGITNIVVKKKELPPEGVHIATIYQIVGLGTHYVEKWKKSQEELQISWESEQKSSNGDPFTIHRPYYASGKGGFLWGNGKKKSQLRKDLEAMLGRQFTEEELENGLNLKKYLKLSSLITITHEKTDDGVMRANILTISAIPKSMAIPELVNPTTFFAVEEFDQTVFDTLPEWMQSRIEESEERIKKHKPISTPDDDVVDEKKEYTNGKTQEIDSNDVPF